MKYKMIVSDLDGTLLDDNRKVSKENIKYINEARKNGFIFAIATGRMYKSAKIIASLIDKDIPIATANGAYTVNGEGKVLLNNPLSIENILKINEVALNHGLYYFFYGKETIYVHETKYEHLERSKYPKSADAAEIIKFDNLEEVLDDNNPIYKSLFISDNYSPHNKITLDLSYIKGLNVTSSMSDNYEITTIGADKGSALDAFSKEFNIPVEQIIAIGDNRNDIAMLNKSGLGVSVYNACEEVKDLSDIITVSNNESPIAKLIKEYVNC